jgi:ABC-type branched-subunit amino acid transport system substrate-binding protein
LKKLAIIFCLLLPTLVFGQRIPDSPREALYQALDSYSQDRYDEAYEKFKRFAEFYSLDGHHTIFQFMAVKSLYKGGHLEQAREGFERFIRGYPGSSYIGAADLFLGHIAYREKRLMDAATYYLKAIDTGDDTRAGKIAAVNLNPLLRKELSLDDLAYLIENYPRSGYAGEIVYFQGKRNYDDGRYKRAARIFEKYLENYTPGKHTDEVKQLYSVAREKAFNKIIIGALIPLTGSYAEYGKEMKNGIELAFAKTDRIDGKEIELLIKDTEGSPVYTTQVAKSLIMEEPAVIIGPLRSESAVGASIVANFNGIPMITPTASEQGISDLGENIYQLSPPAEDIATRLAQFAVENLGITEFGIIAPGDFTGRQVAKAFNQEVYRLGGEVLSSTFYEPGETDFSNQIKPLREQLLMKTEELLATGAIDSTEYFDEDKEEWKDREDWRVYLGGLFLPGYPGELALLVPQIRYHVITTQYLGLDGWDSRDLMEEIKRYVDGSIFATDYHPGVEGNAWDDFFAGYYQAYKSEPGRVAALAYDAACLVRQAIENGATTAADVSRYLDSIENYRGVSCMIDFKATNHTNDAVSIFEINEGSINRLK